MNAPQMFIFYFHPISQEQEFSLGVYGKWLVENYGRLCSMQCNMFPVTLRWGLKTLWTWIKTNLRNKCFIRMANKYMKNCLSSLVIRETQIKTTLRFNLASFRMKTIKRNNNECWQGCAENVQFHCWWDCKLVQLLWEAIWRF